jgi:type IV pilus assembly PilN-like protein
VSARVGIELGPGVIRAIRLTHFRKPRTRTLAYHWDPADPAEAIAALRKSLGAASRLAVAVDLSFLLAKHVRLPPLRASEKRRILTLEPERFFAVRSEELVLALRAEDNLVFAARAAPLEAWISALETIAPVELVEPAPVSLARALGQSAPVRATVLLEERDGGVGIAEVGAGRVHGVRRILNDPEALEAAVAATCAAEGRIYLRPLNGDRGWRPASLAQLQRGEELPTVASIDPSDMVAYGAALGLGGDLEEALLPADLSGRITRRRRRSLISAAAACAVALALALLSLDDFRARGLEELDARIAAVRAQAEGVLAQARQVDALSREAQAVAAIRSERLDPPGPLAALTRRLPADAHILTLRGSGRDWQIDGYAREAAPLVPRLDEDPRFEDVHFLSATSRTRLNGRIYESFSIALRVVPAP